MRHLKEIPQASQAIPQGIQALCNKPSTHPQEILSQWPANSWESHCSFQETHGNSCGNPGQCMLNPEDILRRSWGNLQTNEFHRNLYDMHSSLLGTGGQFSREFKWNSLASNKQCLRKCTLYRLGMEFRSWNLEAILSRCMFNPQQHLRATAKH